MAVAVRLMVAALVAMVSFIVSVELSAAPASAEANVEIGESCTDAGNHRIRLTHDLKVEVQWFLDGRAYLEPSAEQQTIVAAVPGDGKSHLIELLAMPSKELIEAFPVNFAACAAYNAPTTTTDTANADTADLSTAYVTGIAADDADGGLVVRSGPSTSDARLEVLPNDTSVIVVGWSSASTWVEIISPVRGWVGTRYLSTTAPTGATTTTQATTTTTVASSGSSTTTPASPDDTASAATIGTLDEASIDDSLEDDFISSDSTSSTSVDTAPEALASSDDDATGDPEDAALIEAIELDGPDPIAETDSGSSVGLAIFAIGGLVLFGGVIVLMRRRQGGSPAPVEAAPVEAPIDNLPSGEQLLAAASTPLPQRQRSVPDPD